MGQGKLSQGVIEAAMQQLIPEIKRVPIKGIKLNPKNPRTITDEKYRKLKQSIVDAPWMLPLRPMIVNKKHQVIGGNMRLKAFRELGFTEVYIIDADNLTPDQQREFLIKDNLPYGIWDYETLGNDYDRDQLVGWGMDIPKFGKIAAPDGQEDDFESGKITTSLKMGDLIEIGNHRILCGDATSPEDLKKLMGGEQADLGFNDPPYGMKKEKDGVQNDNLNYEKLLEFNKQWIPLQFQHLKKNGSWYCWGIDEPLMDIYCFILKPEIKKNAITYRNLITWDKVSGMGQLSENTRMYATADEKCLFVMMGKQDMAQNKDQFPEEWRPLLEYFRAERDKMGWKTADVVKITGKTSASHYFTESQFQTPTEDHYQKMQEAAKGKAFNRPFEEISMTSFGETEQGRSFLDEFKASRAYFDNMHDNMNNVWHFTRTSQEERKGTGGHATPKPIKLCARGIKSSSPPGGLVLDTFLGSGSTMVAAHQTGRRCFGMELDPLYCQVVIERMINQDPDLKIKVNGKPYKGR